MGEWLALIGSVFYSPSCYRRPKGNVKEEVEVKEPSEENSEDSEKTEPIKEMKQPNSIVNKLNHDEDEDFDD